MGKVTTINRIASLDVLRGIAILGILLANVKAFGYPVLGEMIGFEFARLSGTDLLIEQLTVAFVNGKFRGLLCILFGAGMWLQYRKREAVGESWPGTYLKRMFVLFGIGLFHGLFIWFGDILALYALTACLMFWACGLETKLLWKVVLGLALFAGTCAGGLAFSTAQGAASDIGVEFLTDLIAGEAAAYQSGSYLVQLGYRAFLFGSSLLSGAFLAPMLGMLMILGIILTREGMFTHPSNNPRLRNLLLGVGWTAGIALNLPALWVADAAQLAGYKMFVEFFAAPFLSVAVLISVSSILEHGKLTILFRPFQTIGKVALSVYFLQSLLSTTYFYSYGFGRFGALSRLDSLQFVGVVWVLCWLFAVIWSQFFWIGPVEALWRSKAEGKRIDLRNPPSPPPAAPPVLG